MQYFHNVINGAKWVGIFTKVFIKTGWVGFVTEWFLMLFISYRELSVPSVPHTPCGNLGMLICTLQILKICLECGSYGKIGGLGCWWFGMLCWYRISWKCWWCTKFLCHCKWTWPSFVSLLGVFGCYRSRICCVRWGMSCCGWCLVHVGSPPFVDCISLVCCRDTWLRHTCVVQGDWSWME
jgi:hypothetical protein